MPELELLKRFAPPPTTPTPEARQAARDALLKRTRRRRSPKPLLLVPALAAIAVVLVWPDRESPVDERPAARGPAHGELVPTRPLTPGRYLYTRSHSEWLTVVGDGDGYAALIPNERENWIRLDGTGWMTAHNGEETWLSDRDRERWIAAGRLQLAPSEVDDAIGVDGQGGPGPMTTPSLPTDPGQLLDALRRGKTPDQSFAAFRRPLQESYATPEQRAALYAVADRLPGVTRDPAARDHDGRPGTGFAFDDTDSKVRTQVVIDPETHALLGVTATTLPGYWDDYEPGTVVGWTVIERVEVVDKIKQRP